MGRPDLQGRAPAAPAAREPRRREPGLRGSAADDLETGQDLRPREDYPREPEGYRAGRPRAQDRHADDVFERPADRRWLGADGYREPDSDSGADGYRAQDGYRRPSAYRDPDGYLRPGGYRGADTDRAQDGSQARTGSRRPSDYRDPDGYAGRGGFRSPEGARSPHGYSSTDDDRNRDHYRGPDGARGADGYRGASYNGSDRYRDPGGYRGPDGYRDPGGYRGPDGYGDPGGYRGPDGYRDPGGYRDPDGYRGPDSYRRRDDYRGPDGTRSDRMRPDGMRSDAPRADSRRWPERGAWRPETYSDSTIPGRKLDERDVYVVTDLPERRPASYRPERQDEDRDPSGRRAGDGLRGGVSGPDLGGFGQAEAPGPDGMLPQGDVRLGAGHVDRGDRRYQQVPGMDRAERTDPQADGTVGSGRQDPPRMPVVPLELPAGSRDVARSGNGDPVPLVIDPATQPGIAASPRDEDAEQTSPLPVILPGATAVPRPEPVVAPRGPFEAARPSRPPSVTGSVEPPPAANAVLRPTAALAPLPAMPHSAGLAAPASLSPSPVPEPPPRAVPEAAAAKLDQLKDLYFAAEAIGEDRLEKHFDQVSQRQRDLIREFFERSKPAG